MMDIGKWSEKGDQFLRSKTGKYGNRAEKRDKMILDRNAKKSIFLYKNSKEDINQDLTTWDFCCILDNDFWYTCK